MKVDHLAGSASAVGFSIFAFGGWTGLWGPVSSSLGNEAARRIGRYRRCGRLDRYVRHGSLGFLWSTSPACCHPNSDQRRSGEDRINTLKAMTADAENLAADIDRLLTARGFLNKFEESFRRAAIWMATRFADPHAE